MGDSDLGEALANSPDVCRVGAHCRGGGDVEGWQRWRYLGQGWTKPGEQLLLHGTSRYVRFKRADEEAFREAFKRVAGLPMTLLDLEEGTREELWPRRRVRAD